LEAPRSTEEASTTVSLHVPSGQTTAIRTESPAKTEQAIKKKKKIKECCHE
jgi:hypothetical protein